MRIKSLKHSFSQPYPYYFGQKNLHLVALTLFGLSLAFNYLFEPFVVYRPEHKINFFWICVVHSALPAFLFYTYYTCINLLLSTEDSWTTGKEAIHLVIILLLIGIGNFLVRDIIYDNPNNWSWQYFVEEIRNTFLVGSLIIAIIIPLNFKRLFTKHQHAALALDLNRDGSPSMSDGSSVFIQTQQKADDFHLDLNDFMFARVEGNYTELYLATAQGGFNKLLKRVPLKHLEQQLCAYPWVLKTHRAYIVNTRMIKKINGNALGYQLTFEQYPKEIPVSRSMVPSFDQMLDRDH